MEKWRLSQISMLAAKGCTESQIAKRLGLKRRAFLDMVVDDAEVRQALEEGRATNALVEKALLEKALKGDIRAQLFWLKNRLPERWRDKPEGAGEGGFSVSLAVEDEKESE